MRVVMAGDFPRKPDEIGGGVEAVTTYLANALQALPDIELEAVTLDRWGGAARSEMQRDVMVHFVPLSRRPSRLSNRQNVHRMSDRIRALAPDLVHAQVANQYAAAAKHSGFPWVLTAHGIRHLEMALRPGLLNRYRGAMIRREEFHLMAAAQHLISISPFITDVFNAHISATTTQIDNPVDGAFFDASRNAQDASLLYVGRLIPRKDILTLLKAFVMVKEQVPEAELRLAGEGITGLEPTGYPAQMMRFIEQHGLTEAVTFLGQLDDAALIAEYEKCSLMVVSSILETAPMVILQAMAAGVPVVSTDVGGIRYLVEHDSSGAIVAAGDAAALGREVVAILKDPEKCLRFGQHARRLAESRLRASDVAARTRDVYVAALQSAS
ncbi:MAG TPA: glycosyltransferase family 4 protein [Woeseiaceae bacterium]|nr:glycosyltransferase family 4 protein [Woeseiaceae bacterium]